MDGFSEWGSGVSVRYAIVILVYIATDTTLCYGHASSDASISLQIRSGLGYTPHWGSGSGGSGSGGGSSGGFGGGGGGGSGPSGGGAYESTTECLTQWGFWRTIIFPVALVVWAISDAGAVVTAIN
ncbi:hypothetical protein BDR26DRAFT_929308 [Obelidium mucronatum]|nr:hypothetical protein BDR26DRAFT_929308 [Obelidium mucronatum]